MTIDGSQTPEMVTDAEAYNVWFIALAEPNNSTPEAARRFGDKLSPLTLGAPDAAVLTGALAAFKQEFDKIMAMRLQLSTGTSSEAVGQTADQLRTEEDSLVATTRQTLETGMSPAGWSRLNTYVTVHVKSRIKIYVVQH